MDSLAVRQPRLSGAALACRTAWPTVLEVRYDIERPNGDGSGSHLAHEVAIEVGVPRLLPEAFDLAPQGATRCRGRFFSAASFNEMPIEQRERHKPHYSAFLVWCAALEAGVKPGDVLAGVHYEPAEITARVESWAGFGLWDSEAANG